MTDEMRLEMPVDPAYAVTARLFVAAAARSLGIADGAVEDLRLAASELVANAVETRDPGPILFVMSREGSEVVLDATGIGRLGDAPPISRRALLEGLFDATEIEHEANVRIRVGLEAGSPLGKA
jgi:enoyl-CoA hydratase/carnithine racemase